MAQHDEPTCSTESLFITATEEVQNRFIICPTLKGTGLKVYGYSRIYKIIKGFDPASGTFDHQGVSAYRKKFNLIY